MAYDVTKVDIEEMEAYKDCAENARVTNDVTSVRDDGKRNKAHTESAEQVHVAYDVTTLDEDVQ